MSFLLLPSPLLGPSVWSPVARSLRAHGHLATLATLPERRTSADVLASYVEQARACSARVLVPHSNAGLYAPSVAAELPGPVDIVFVDAGLPADGGPTTIAPPGLLAFLEGLGSDGRLPPWTRWWPEDEVARLFPGGPSRRTVEAEQVPLPLEYFRSTLTAPEGWSGRPGGYLAFGSTYSEELARARLLGWPTLSLYGEHLHLLHDPDAVSGAVEQLAAELESRRPGSASIAR